MDIKKDDLAEASVLSLIYGPAVLRSAAFNNSLLDGVDGQGPEGVVDGGPLCQADCLEPAGLLLYAHVGQRSLHHVQAEGRRYLVGRNEKITIFLNKLEAVYL